MDKDDFRNEQLREYLHNAPPELKELTQKLIDTGVLIPIGYSMWRDTTEPDQNLTWFNPCIGAETWLKRTFGSK